MGEPTQWMGLLQWSLKYQDSTQASRAQALSEDDKAWLEEAFKAGTRDENEVVRALLLRLRAECAGEGEDGISDAKVAELGEEVEDVVDILGQVDRAKDFLNLGGPSTLVTLLHSRSPFLRASACSLLSTVAQNNPPVQAHAINPADPDQHTTASDTPPSPPLLPLVTHIAVFDKDARVRRKALGAVSCVIRNHEEGERKFLEEGDGVLVLTNALGNEEKSKGEGEGEVVVVEEEEEEERDRLRTKAAHLLAHLARRHPDTVFSSLSSSSSAMSSLSSLLERGGGLNLTEAVASVILVLASHKEALVGMRETGVEAAVRERLDNGEGVEETEKTMLREVLDLFEGKASVRQSPREGGDNDHHLGHTSATQFHFPGERPDSTNPNKDAKAPSKDQRNTKKQEKVLVPTSEWQEVPQGTHLPPGLHIRMDLSTGKRFAKLIDPNEEQTFENAVVVSPTQSHSISVEGRGEAEE